MTKTSEQLKFYMRFHDAALYRMLLSVAAETNQPLREVIERACKFALEAKDFVVPVHESTLDKLAASQTRRLEKLKSRAGGES